MTDRLHQTIFTVKTKILSASPRRLPTRAVAGPKHIANTLQRFLTFNPPSFMANESSKNNSGTILKRVWTRRRLGLRLLGL